MYSVWPPVSLRVRVSLGIGSGLELRSGSVFRLATFMYPVCRHVPHFPYDLKVNFYLQNICQRKTA